MKVTALVTLLAIGASSASAAAVAEPDAWCLDMGEPCWKVKRAAEAFSSALASSGGSSSINSEVARRSNHLGGAAYNAKRGLSDLAGIISATQNSPRDFYAGLNLDGHFPAVSKREAEAEAAPEAWCLDMGEPCWKAKREAEAWCLDMGEPCWKAKRAAEAVIETIDGFSKREAEPAAEAWCLDMGEPCWKRSAEAWCLDMGEPCWKRSAEARRDLHGIYNAARSVLDNLPSQE